MELKSFKTQRLGIALMVLLAIPGAALAQSHAKDTTMNRTVVVEQQYNPDIMDAQKVNVLPEINELSTTPNEVEYDRSVAPATVLPGTAMAAYAGEEKQDLTKQGYLRAGYGNIGNLDVEGNYLFNLTSKDKLNFSLGMQGMDGKVYYPGSSDKWDGRFYRTRADIDYMHRFNTMDMNVAGNFGLSNFNYMPGLLRGHQRFTSGDVRFGLKSTDRSLPIHFNAETGLYFYQRGHNCTAESNDKSLNETMVRTKGNFTGDMGDSQQIGVAFEMNNLFYNNDLFENRTTLLLKPYYELLEEDVWKLHLGVNVDLGFGFGKKFRVSPDVTAEYTFSDSYVLYANATGGRILNDFRQFEQSNPYGELLLGQNEDSYEQLNAMLGFKMSPATGLWLNIFGGYQQINDDLCNLIITPLGDDVAVYAVAFPQGKTKNFNAGLQANYAYKDIFNVMVKGQYYNWDADKDNDIALCYKPEFRLDFQTNVRPVSELNINLAYEFVRRAEMYDLFRAHNLSNLSLGATYKLFDNMSIYARASNLLNRKADYYMAAPVPGINFLGGVIFSF